MNASVHTVPVHVSWIIFLCQEHHRLYNRCVYVALTQSITFITHWSPHSAHTVHSDLICRVTLTIKYTNNLKSWKIISLHPVLRLHKICVKTMYVGMHKVLASFTLVHWHQHHTFKILWVLGLKQHSLKAVYMAQWYSTWELQPVLLKR
jgi:hypothetical protein